MTADVRGGTGPEEQRVAGVEEASRPGGDSTTGELTVGGGGGRTYRTTGERGEEAGTTTRPTLEVSLASGSATPPVGEDRSGGNSSTRGARARPAGRPPWVEVEGGGTEEGEREGPSVEPPSSSERGERGWCRPW